MHILQYNFLLIKKELKEQIRSPVMLAAGNKNSLSQGSRSARFLEALFWEVVVLLGVTETVPPAGQGPYFPVEDMGGGRKKQASNNLGHLSMLCRKVRPGEWSWRDAGGGQRGSSLLIQERPPKEVTFDKRP